MTVLLFLAVLFVLVLVHEWGHFIVAKKTGMRVEEFGIGFPPKLFGMKKGETVYTFNALPIGGFVKILGENMTDADATVPGSFSSKSKWAQAAVLIAGVTMNILFAWMLFVGAFMIGVPLAVDESTATEAAQLTVSSVVPESPASGVIPVGAVIVGLSAGDVAVTDLTPVLFREFIQTHGDQELSVTYFDGASEQTVTIVPEENLVADSEQPAIGVAITLVGKVSLPIHAAISKATLTTVDAFGAIVQGVYSLIVDSIQGDADYSQIAGPVGIVHLVGDAAAFGITSLMLFTAVISLNLAVINLLPFPALDGGRLLFVAIEAVIRRPINPVWVARLNTLGFILLMLLMVAVTYNDIVIRWF